MLHPIEVDGRTLVILRRSSRWLGSQFIVETSGRLEFDGETLTLVGDNVQWDITKEELASLMTVKPDTLIAECRGFDLFLVLDAKRDGCR